MGTARGWCAAGVLEDRYVFVSGGQGAKSFLKSAEVRILRDGVRGHEEQSVLLLSRSGPVMSC